MSAAVLDYKLTVLVHIVLFPCYTPKFITPSIDSSSAMIQSRLLAYPDPQHLLWTRWGTMFFFYKRSNWPTISFQSRGTGLLFLTIPRLHVLSCYDTYSEPIF